MVSSTGKSRTRKRGIRASRLKLEKAMAEAGFKTQAALAERIAENEQLENLPRDFVSRVFREQAVEPSSLERIANALNVEAYTLYQSTTDYAIPPQISAESAITDSVEKISEQKNDTLVSKPNYWRLFITLIVVVLLVVFVWQQVDSNKTTNNQNLSVMDLENVSIAVLDFSHPSLLAFSNRLRETMASKFQAPSHAALTLNNISSGWETVENLQVDYVLEGEVLQYGRNIGLLIYLINEDSRKLLATFTGLSLVNTEENLQSFDDKVALTVEQQFNGTTSTDEQILSKESISYYLQGLLQVDDSLIEINIRRAFDFIQRSLRIAPNFAKGKAALCDILVRQSIVNGDKSLLTDANNECEQAYLHGSSLAEVQYAFGQVRRKQGQTDNAVQLYKNALAIYPMYVDAHLGLAEAYINKAQQTQDQNYFDLALQHTSLAEHYEPTFWKIPFVSSRIHYFKGDVDTAIFELERSKNLFETHNNVANLGTMYFCNGDMPKAEQNYLKLAELSGPNAMNDNFLGVINFAKEDYPKAVEYFDASLQKMLADGSQGLYLAWINLADAYFANNELEQASKAYQQGIIIADQYSLKGENTNNIQAHIFYSHLKLYQTAHLTIDEQKKLTLISELTPIAEQTTDPDALVRIMLSWVELDHIEQARPIFDSFANSCKGYASYPLLKKHFD